MCFKHLLPWSSSSLLPWTRSFCVKCNGLSLKMKVWKGNCGCQYAPWVARRKKSRAEAYIVKMHVYTENHPRWCPFRNGQFQVLGGVQCKVTIELFRTIENHSFPTQCWEGEARSKALRTQRALARKLMQNAREAADFGFLRFWGAFCWGSQLQYQYSISCPRCSALHPPAHQSTSVYKLAIKKRKKRAYSLRQQPWNQHILPTRQSFQSKNQVHMQGCFEVWR